MGSPKRPEQAEAIAVSFNGPEPEVVGEESRKTRVADDVKPSGAVWKREAGV
jgi:hypothetical protein